MGENLLDIIESEASENCQSTIKPDIFGKCECSYCGNGKDERGESGDDDDCETCHERSTDVKVFLLFSGSSDERDRSHHCHSIQSRSGHDCWRCHEEKRGEQDTLGYVECRPESIFLYIAFEMLAEFLDKKVFARKTSFRCSNFLGYFKILSQPFKRMERVNRETWNNRLQLCQRSKLSL